MNPEGWNKLEAEARWALEHAEQVEPREPLYGMALQLRLWHDAGAGLRLSWSLIVPVREYRERRALVREVRWDRAADWELAARPSAGLKRRALAAPSLRIRDAEIGWAELSPFLKEAGGLPMTERGAPGPGEGASGFEGYRSLAHVRREWIGKGPRGGDDAVAWFTRLRKRLARVMREREREAGSA